MLIMGKADGVRAHFGDQRHVAPMVGAGQRPALAEIVLVPRHPMERQMPAVEEKALFGVEADGAKADRHRSEEHTSELQSLMRTSYAVFCMKKNKNLISTT